MNAKEHLNLSMYSLALLSAGFAVAHTKINIDASVTDAVLVVIGVGFGSLLPDIDHPKAHIGKVLQFWRIHRLLSRFKRYRKGNKIFKHGGITHTIVANGLIIGLAYYLESLPVTGIAFGYFTHLYADHITGNKLPMLYYPFKKN